MSKTVQLQKPVDIKSIKDLIDNRQILKLRKLFESEQQQRQASYMFFYFNKKNWRISTSPLVIFEDKEYLVLNSYRGYSRNHGLFSAIWVIGVDNGVPWIHRPEWNEKFEDNNWRPTKAEVKKIMGFDSAVKQNTVFRTGKVIRLQGDLTIERRDRKSFEEWKESNRKIQLKQTNLRLGNHLVIIEKAIHISTISNIAYVLIREPTNGYVIHDQHENKQIVLEPGAYEFKMLRRHVTDARRTS